MIVDGLDLPMAKVFLNLHSFPTRGNILDSMGPLGQQDGRVLRAVRTTESHDPFSAQQICLRQPNGAELWELTKGFVRGHQPMNNDPSAPFLSALVIEPTHVSETTKPLREAVWKNCSGYMFRSRATATITITDGSDIVASNTSIPPTTCANNERDKQRMTEFLQRGDIVSVGDPGFNGVEIFIKFNWLELDGLNDPTKFKPYEVTIETNDTEHGSEVIKVCPYPSSPAPAPWPNSHRSYIYTPGHDWCSVLPVQV